MRKSYPVTGARKVVKNMDEWELERSNIKAMIIEGKATMAFLGNHYGVSRQRMHQVIQQLDIEVFPVRTSTPKELHKRVVSRMVTK